MNTGFASWLTVPGFFFVTGSLGSEANSREVERLGLPTFPSQREESTAGDPGVVKPSPSKDEALEDAEGPFILSEALPVIPAKLVRRILRPEYVDMAELLKDNMEAERRKLAAEAGSHFTRREVPDILSWIQCFNMYMAVVVSKYPGKTKEMLAYQALIVGESRRGGRGWRLYDAAFRQQIRSLESVNFARINQSLYSTTILAFSGGRQTFCAVCMQSDHTQEECGLQASMNRQPTQGRDLGVAAPVRGLDRRKRERVGACYAWNEGRCTFVRCRYEHVCSRCGGEHRKPQCREALRRGERGAGGPPLMNGHTAL